MVDNRSAEAPNKKCNVPHFCSRWRFETTHICFSEISPHTHIKGAEILEFSQRQVHMPWVWERISWFLSRDPTCQSWDGDFVPLPWLIILISRPVIILGQFVFSQMVTRHTFRIRFHTTAFWFIGCVIELQVVLKGLHAFLLLKLCWQERKLHQHHY